MWLHTQRRYNLKVVEIFESIDGEGIRAGYPVTFIRLFGCNLNCSYCDSRYACEGTEYEEMCIKKILSKVKKLGHKRITLIGGESLIHIDVGELIRNLDGGGYEVNIETDGAVFIKDYLQSNHIITLDYKCPSSKMESKMILDNLHLLRKKDVLKFVVGSKEDLQRAKQIIDSYSMQGRCSIYFSPVFNSITAEEIVQFILRNHLDEVRVQLQLHKYIWDPQMKGV